MNMAPLLNEPYVNKVTLTEHNLYQKSYKSSELNLCLLGGWDLSKQALWVSVEQLAAKLQAVKVGGLKKILPLCRPRATRVRLWLRGRIV